MPEKGKASELVKELAKIFEDPDLVGSNRGSSEEENDGTPRLKGLGPNDDGDMLG